MNFGGTLRLNKSACFFIIFLMLLLFYWRTSGPSEQIVSKDFVNLKSVLTAAIYAAERGGKKVSEGREKALNIESKGKTLEGADNVVTAADFASHCAMYHGLKKTFPKVHVVSEEHVKADPECENQEPLETERVPFEHSVINEMSDELVLAKDVTIWIDPLDATKEYTEGLLQYVTTMVCVAVRGNPIIGVIHYPFSLKSYWGWYSKRASSNILLINHKSENRQSPRIVVSLSHPGKVAAMAKDAYGPSAIVNSAAGAGYKVMGVVNGTYDIYLHTTAIKKWDLCAGDAILKTMDGRMSTTHGEDIDYSPGTSVVVTDGIIASLFDHSYYLSKVPKIISGIL